MGDGLLRPLIVHARFLKRTRPSGFEPPDPVESVTSGSYNCSTGVTSEAAGIPHEVIKSLFPRSFFPLSAIPVSPCVLPWHYFSCCFGDFKSLVSPTMHPLFRNGPHPLAGEAGTGFFSVSASTRRRADLLSSIAQSALPFHVLCVLSKEWRTLRFFLIFVVTGQTVYSAGNIFASVTAFPIPYTNVAPHRAGASPRLLLTCNHIHISLVLFFYSKHPASTCFFWESVLQFMVCRFKTRLRS